MVLLTVKCTYNYITYIIYNCLYYINYRIIIYNCRTMSMNDNVIIIII